MTTSLTKCNLVSTSDLNQKWKKTRRFKNRTRKLNGNCKHILHGRSKNVHKLMRVVTANSLGVLMSQTVLTFAAGPSLLLQRDANQHRLNY